MKNRANYSPSGTSLEGIDLFKGLSVNDRDEIASLCRIRSFRKNDVIVSHEDTSTDVFFILSGTVRIAIYSLAGKQITFRDLHAGQVFGELSAIDSKPRSAHVVSLKESVLAFVGADDFWLVLSKYPEVNRNTLKYLTKLVRALSDRVVEFNTLDAKSRLCAELLRLARINENAQTELIISPAPTHAELANRVSSNREAVTRELSSLSKLGIIEKDGRTLLIRNLGKLEQLVKGD